MPVTGPTIRNTGNVLEDEALPRNTVHAAVEVPLVMVKYTDGYGKTHTRLALLLDNQPFLLDSKVSDGAKASQKWFSEQLLKKLGKVSKKSPEKPVEVAEATKNVEVPKINMDAM